MNDEPDSTNPATHRTWWDRLSNLFVGEPRNREELVEELRSAYANGLLSADTLPMLEGALKVTELSADDVMIPRMQIVMIAASAPLTQILNIVIESRHSRFPVHGENKDEILGILLAKDLLKCFVDDAHVEDANFDMRTLLRPAMLIPESMRLNVLLAEFRRSRNHMAIVVDEYGGMAGLATIEDVLEQIVGNIDDEHDDDDPELIQPQSDGSWLVSALTPIEDFNETLGGDFSDTEFDTIGGLITAEFGHLPTTGEETVTGTWLFHITRADDRRVQQIRVRRCPI